MASRTPARQRGVTAASGRRRGRSAWVESFDNELFSDFFSQMRKLFGARSPLYRCHFFIFRTSEVMPNFARKYSLESFWRDLQDLHAFGPLRPQNPEKDWSTFSNNSGKFWQRIILQILWTFSKKISNFQRTNWDSKTVQRSALYRSRRELSNEQIANSNEYLLAKFGFDTAENEP